MILRNFVLRLRSDLVAARKARQPDAVSALRTALAAIDNAEAIDVSAHPEERANTPIAGARSGIGSTEVGRRVLTIGEVRAILAKEVLERTSAAESYDSLGQTDAASR